MLTKAEFLKYRERKTQDEITQTLLKEFNWGSGPAAGNIPGMLQELRS